MPSQDSPQVSTSLREDALHHAIQLFNLHDWYAAHDAFEELWHDAEGDQRGLLQGIIQIAVAEHHLSSGNKRGALLLMAEGLNHLVSCPLQDACFDLPSLMAIVHQRLTGLQTGLSLVDIPLPKLVQVAPNKA